MTAKVIVLPVITTLDVPAERILSGAIEAKLETAVVIGRDTEGKFYFASSVADGGDVLWLMEIAKAQLLRVTGDIDG